MTKRFAFPSGYGADSILVEIDRALVPIVSGLLSAGEDSYIWLTPADYELGYNALAELQVELMGRSINRLILEIRAMRGVDDLAPGYNDPQADPFTLSLGTIEDNRRELQLANERLELIRLAVEAMSGAETLDEIRDSAATIALLLA
jgi:hypothetical protein